MPGTIFNKTTMNEGSVEAYIANSSVRRPRLNRELDAVQYPVLLAFRRQSIETQKHERDPSQRQSPLAVVGLQESDRHPEAKCHI